MSRKKLKIALIVPNFYWCDWDKNSKWEFIPYNLCLLGAMVEDISEVKIIDANVADYSETDFIDEITQFNPDIAGITILMDQYGVAGHHAAKLIKKCKKEIKVIFGGVYATTNSEKVSSDENIDYTVLGEGEYVFKDLIKFFMGTGPLPEKGIAYFENGNLIDKGHSEFIFNLDDLPLPAYHLIDYKKYSTSSVQRKSVDSPQKYPYARIFTSRGCPFDCVFCQVESINGRKFRGRSPENVLAEIEWLKNEHGIQSIIFDDDNFFVNRDRAKEILQGMIDRNLIMPWIAIAVAAFKLNDEIIELMKRSGCNYMDIAVESGTERVLKSIVNKPLNLENAKKVVSKAKREGIYVAANFIVGFPGETWSEIRATLKYAEDLNADYVKIYSPIPLPKTRLWDICEEEGYFKKGFTQDSSRWNIGQIETAEFTARDLTILRAYEWDRINFTDFEKRKRTAQLMNVSEEELQKIRRNTLFNASHPKSGAENP